MELRYQLKNDHYERENPDNNLKLNELLFLKYFEPEVEKRMKRFDTLVSSHTYPISIIEKIIKITVLMFYMLLCFVLVSYYFTIDPNKSYSLNSQTKNSSFENSFSFLTNFFNPNLKQKLLNCSFSEKYGIYKFECLDFQNEKEWDSEKQNGTSTAGETDSVTLEPPTIINFPVRSIKLISGDAMFDLKEKTFLFHPPIHVRIGLIFTVLFGIFTVILSSVLKFIKSESDKKLMEDTEYIILDENVQQNSYQFYMIHNHASIRIRINNSEANNANQNDRLSSVIIDKPQSSSPIKNSIESINRNGYQSIPSEIDEFA